MLSIKNPHKRDAQITFDEGPHIYTIHLDNGVKDSGYMSVTTWNHSHFGHFDADAVITNMMKGRNWNPSNKYYGKTADEIKAGWEQNRDEAARAGTKMHYDIECYYNGIELKEPNTSLEYTHFMNFVKAFPELKPYRTEWMIWDEEHRFAGSIDMVFEKEDGTLMIYDWKRSKEIKKTGVKYSHTECIEHLPDTNFWHYSLQLNTYKTILEEKYGKKITGLYLVCLHPDNPYKTYDRIEVPFLEKEMKHLFDERRREERRRFNTKGSHRTYYEL
jgi:hypothetical protein